jgi:putative thioredoxin
MIFDVAEADFEQKVVERSKEVPVVVDFWAEWCGPCRALTPALEKAAQAREGRVDLAKLDTDANQSLAQAFRVQSIPAVKAFKNGQVVAEFVGAQPPPQVERFFDSIVPSDEELAADAAVASGDEAELRQVLAGDPSSARAATSLARILLARGENENALKVLEPVMGDFVADGLEARARLALAGAGEEAWTAWDGSRLEEALEALQRELVDADADRKDLIRQAMVAIFTELGPDSELARDHRRRLASALY